MKRISIGKHDTIRLGLGLRLTPPAACGDDDPKTAAETPSDETDIDLDYTVVVP